MQKRHPGTINSVGAELDDSRGPPCQRRAHPSRLSGVFGLLAQGPLYMLFEVCRVTE